MSENIREPLEAQRYCRKENRGHDGVLFSFEGKNALVCRKCGYVLPILRSEPMKDRHCHQGVATTS